jgi:predicted nucleic acid-binding protein
VTTASAQLQLFLPPRAVPWVPDGLFYAEVMSVLRRWELRSTLSSSNVAAAFQRLVGWRLRRATVTSLATDAWSMRHNLTFTDACYVALARRLDAPLLTSDMRLAAAPNLPVQVLHAP